MIQPPRYTVPPGEQERTRLRGLVRSLLEREAVVPPLSLDRLALLARQLTGEQGLDPLWHDWLLVEINNGAWRETMAAVPYEKRILLLPKCLSHSSGCEAEVDELGLLCRRCQRCPVPSLQDEAERLGIMSLVAEGFTSVVGLIKNRVVDTVIGVGCLESLEKAFPLLVENAVPGMAVPLNRAGCRDTQVDTAYVLELLAMRAEPATPSADDALPAILEGWFSRENLSARLPAFTDLTSVLAADWLGGDGKRWRPYLLAATYRALTGEQRVPEEVELSAIAVECFHKASLVHDDIQDNDDFRYGKQTVHALHGVPVAINVGDMLLGEGYRLLGECRNRELLPVAARAHILLCRGQGMELEWTLAPRPVTLEEVLEIFTLKTAPAFDVALVMGVLCAGGDSALCDRLSLYSRHLAIAYQLKDDMEDFDREQPMALRPSAVVAAICESHPAEALLGELLRAEDINGFLRRERHRSLLQQALESVGELADKHHRLALEVLEGVTNVELKRLLFRVTARILKN